jgi:DNA-directed RNA polymerase subunit RPC12/RpoP
MPENDVVEYKCPNCGGGLKFDSKSQNMSCPYCGTEFDVEAVKEYAFEAKKAQTDSIEWETYDKNSGSGDWKEGEQDGLKLYVCQSCGGELECDDTQSATFCPYCGNPVIMSDRVSSGFRPDIVIPFKITKDDAKDSFFKFCKKKFLIPNDYVKTVKIDKITGMYVPYWLYDAGTETHAILKAEKVRKYTTTNYYVTETRHYRLTRTGIADYQDLPVDGLTKIENEFTEAIEPFDMKSAVNFDRAYLSGDFADKYDVSAEDGKPIANNRMKNTNDQMIKDSVQGYSSVSIESSQINISDGKIKYAVFPVFLMNTMYKGKKYTFAVNGQTGKFAGNLPSSKLKATIMSILTFLAGTAVVGLLATLAAYIF